MPRTAIHAIPPSSDNRKVAATMSQPAPARHMGPQASISASQSRFFLHVSSPLFRSDSCYTLVVSENSFSVRRIHFLQDFVGQRETINLPASLPWISRIIEVFIRCFQPPEIVGVHLLLGIAVCSKKDAVLILLEELSRAPWLAAELGLASAKFEVHIRVFIEPRGDGIKVFRPVGNVKGDECRVRVLLEDMIAFREKRFLARELRTVKTPRRIVHKFFITFVAIVRRPEKSLGIARMNGHRNTQLAALLPNRVEPRVVHRNQLAGLVFHAEAKILEHF